MERLKSKPRIVIGSTGRILDLIRRRKIQAHLVKIIVLDEGDRLLEDGNIADVREVVRATLKERQIAATSTETRPSRKSASAVLRSSFPAVP